MLISRLPPFNWLIPAINCSKSYIQMLTFLNPVQNRGDRKQNRRRPHRGGDRSGRRGTKTRRRHGPGESVRHPPNGLFAPVFFPVVPDADDMAPFRWEELEEKPAPGQWTYFEPKT